MVCCVCKQKEAKVHYSKLEGDKVQKVDLCEECAKQKGFDDPSGFALVDLLMGIGTTAAEPESAAGTASEPRCPRCGFTQADFKKSGRLGCAQCYDTFAESLQSVLKSMHKGVQHSGKVPVALQQTREAPERLQSLQKKLSRAIQEENFEQAAVLRDEIKQLQARQPQPAASAGAGA